ncbi:MAG: helix-turn-helix transcriptional regulator [Treponemataceae bacterium]
MRRAAVEQIHEDEAEMPFRKKSIFFIRSFYRWPVLGLCLTIGTLCLWFYYHSLTVACDYPAFFPIGLYVFNVIVLCISTPLVKRAIARGELKPAFHRYSAGFFILLLVSPSLTIIFAKPFISALWAIHVACYIFYCLSFCGFRPIDWSLPALPLCVAVLHIAVRFYLSGDHPDVGTELMYGTFTTIIYALIYLFLSFYLDIKEEVLSVYLENKDLDGFLNSFNLSPREAEVVGHIINGAKSRKIAETLFISEGTVKNHVKSIYKKMGINSRMELMHLVWDFSLLRPGTNRVPPSR